MGEFSAAVVRLVGDTVLGVPSPLFVLMLAASAVLAWAAWITERTVGRE